APSVSAAPFRAAGSHSSLDSLWNASLGGLLATPLPDPRVVAREEHVRDFHASVLGRPRELRPACRFVRAVGEAVLGEGARVADDSRNEPRHRVDENHRGDLTAAQHIIADRNLSRAQRGANAVVDALVTTADDDQTRLLRQLGREPLVEPFAPGLGDEHGAWILTADGLHGFDHGFGFHHHPRAAAEWNVVDLTVPVVREVTQVVGVQSDHASLQRPPDHTLPEGRIEHGREDGDDVESHRTSCASSTLRSQSATTTWPAGRSTLTMASLVAGMRCSIAPSRLTHTSLAGRSKPSAITPSRCPELVPAGSPDT